MKSFILPFVIALIAGIGVAGGAAVMSAKPAPIVADSGKHASSDTSGVRVIDSAGALAHDALTPSDSLAKSAVARPEVTVAAPAHAANGVPAVPTTPVASGPSVASASGPASTNAVPKGTLASTASSPDAPPAEKRIARVIAAMAPRDAAKVLGQMADHDVAIIIGNLSEKQEAAILAALPADRLASVSKLLLKTPQAPK